MLGFHSEPFTFDNEHYLVREPTAQQMGEIVALQEAGETTKAALLCIKYCLLNSDKSKVFQDVSLEALMSDENLSMGAVMDVTRIAMHLVTPTTEKN